MKKLLLSLVTLMAIINSTKAQELVGVGQTYTTLKAAFDDINAGNLTGAIELQITSSTTNAALAVLNAAGSGFASYSSVKIYPIATGYTINENIVLSGADNVTIDGRVNMTGTSRDMTVISSGSGNAILINDGAEHNKIKYLHLISGGYSITVRFGNNPNFGNNYNKISNCLIESNDRNYSRPGMLQSGQYANGVYNHHDTVINNEFKNIFSYDQTSFPPYTKTAAILLSTYNYAWQIEGNSFYDEGFVQNAATRCSPAAIRVSPPLGINLQAHKIIGNYIGGSQAFCGGGPLSATSNTAAELQFVGIDAGGNNDSLIIEGNVIRNIVLNNNKSIEEPLYSSELNYGFIGISCAEGNIVARNNTIGSNTMNGQIVNNVTNGADTIVGIVIGSYTAAIVKTMINSNHIGGISSTATGTNLCSIVGIYSKRGTGYNQILNNEIGSETMMDNIHAQSTTTATQNVRGILVTAGDSCKIWNNTIANLTNMSTNNTITTLSGIWVPTPIKNFNQWNKVMDLKGNGTAPFPGNYTVIGIISSGAANSKFNNNTVKNIANINTDPLNLAVVGISTSGLDTFNKNYISNISTASTGAGSTAIGLLGSAFYVTNNIVNMGTSSRRVYGFYEVSLFSIYNTIVINGTNSNFESAAFKSGTSNNYVLKNNLLINNKQNLSGTSSRHFAIVQNHTVPVPASECNYNNYYVYYPSNGGAVAKADFIEYVDFATYAAIYSGGQNANSTNLDPMFVDINSNNPSGFVPMQTGILANNVASITEDFYSNTRSGALLMGALQSSAPLPLSWKSFTATKQSNGALLNWITATEENTAYFEIQKSSDAKTWTNLGQVRSIGNATTETAYEYFDAEIVFGKSFYRIRQIDVDGKSTYSVVRQISNQLENEIIVYPNPCTMNTIKIALKEEAKDMQVTIYSIDGIPVLSSNLNAQNSNLDISALAKGTYLIRMSSNDKLYTSKFVKQ